MNAEAELKLPCQFQPGDQAIIRVTVNAVSFDEGKVRYDIAWGDGDGAHGVDSCDLMPIMTGEQIEAELKAGTVRAVSLRNPHAAPWAPNGPSPILRTDSPTMAYEDALRGIVTAIDCGDEIQGVRAIAVGALKAAE